MDRVMDENRLKGILDAEIDNALGYLNTETTEQRRMAVRAYNRDPMGNEVEGRSQIVTGEVAEAVDGAMPQLLRIFTQSDEVVRFEPRGPGDEELAKQATEYCNWVLNNENAGAIILHDWFKDALLQKNGILKVWWEDQTDVTVEKYENLSEEELALLLSDGQYEIVSQESEQIGEVEVPPSPEEMMMAQQSGQMPMPSLQPVFSYNVKVKKIDKKGCVKIENVPPEEFIVSKKTRRLADTTFCAHRRLVTRSELVAMGYDKDEVADLPAYDDLTYTPERTARFSNGEQPDDTSLDPAMQEVECFECYIRVDMDKDGIAELRKVFYAGKNILDNYECDYVPFCSLCPIPMPHKFFGHSLADRTIDIQTIKSTITRQILDNLYLSNNARMAVVDGQVNLDDMLTVTPGGIVRVKNNAAITPLTVPQVASQAFPMLAYMDQMQEKRTGVTQTSQGLDPNVLQNTTATAVAMMQNAGAAKIELIARIFAETGVKDLFKNILHLVCKYQDKERIIRLRGKFIAIDPREWDSGYDISVNVGLGTGNKEQQLSMIGAVLQKQEQMFERLGIANPLVSPSQYRNTLGRFIESAGFKDSAEFFNEITPEVEQQIIAAQQQQKPNQEDQVAQAYAQVEQMKAQFRAESDAAKIQLEREKAMADLAMQQAKLEIEREKAASQIRAEQVKLIQESAKLSHEGQLQERKQLLEELKAAQADLKNEIQSAEASVRIASLIDKLSRGVA
jgi:hypothetical protein